MKTKNELLENFLANLNTEVDVLNCVDLDNVTDYNSLYLEIEDSSGFDIEIIYYGRAMEYLMKNDPSLQESLSLAADMGFTPENLNSELLASLLASEAAREDFAALETEVNEFFESVAEIRQLQDELAGLHADRDEIVGELVLTEDPREVADLESQLAAAQDAVKVLQREIDEMIDNLKN